MYDPFQRPFRDPVEARRVLGVALRETRRLQGLTQLQLEGLAQVDQTVISRLECGRPVGFRLKSLFRLLDALEVRSIELRPVVRRWPWR